MTVDLMLYTAGLFIFGLSIGFVTGTWAVYRQVKLASAEVIFCRASLLKVADEAHDGRVDPREMCDFLAHIYYKHLPRVRLKDGSNLIDHEIEEGES